MLINIFLILINTNILGFFKTSGIILCLSLPEIENYSRATRGFLRLQAVPKNET